MKSTKGFSCNTKSMGFPNDEGVRNRLRILRKQLETKLETEIVEVEMTRTFSLLGIKSIKNLKTTSQTTASFE